jgi:hypothetical protein
LNVSFLIEKCTGLLYYGQDYDPFTPLKLLYGDKGYPDWWKFLPLRPCGAMAYWMLTDREYNKAKSISLLNKSCTDSFKKNILRK